MRYLASAETAYATLARAQELGINHFETAQSYGKSELFLGQALASLGPLSREQVYITTKITPKSHPQPMAEAIAQSLDRLGLDYVDCLAIHGLNTWEHLQWVQEGLGCWPAIEQAIASGQVRHVGFSSHGSLELILAAIQMEQFEFVNLHYTYFFQRNAPAVAAAIAKEMGVFIISPADKGGLLYTPPQSLINLCLPLSPLHLNARFLLSQPGITTLSVGAANPSELDWPLAIANQTHPLTPAEQKILAQLDQHQSQTLTTDRCHQCYACLPCPENINIPEVLRLRNLAIAYDMETFWELSLSDV